MKVLGLTVLAASLLAATASAGLPVHPGSSRSTGVFLLATQTASTGLTAKTIPSSARTIVNASFNGKPSQVCWPDSQNQIECGWHGVLAIISAKRGRGYGTVRVVSVRPDPVKVFVRFSW